MQYAESVGIVDVGLAGDFEQDRPTEAQRQALSGVEIVVSTGAVGYIGSPTFRAILDSCARPPWVVSFVLRMFSYEEVAHTLADYGLVTERLDSAAFVQRRFSGPDEAEKMLAELAARGVDMTGLEADGLLYAELYVSRPKASVQTRPLGQIVTVASGRNISFGPRLLAVRRDGRGRLIVAR